MDMSQAFNKARLFTQQAVSLLTQAYFTSDPPNTPIAGKIWHVPAPNAAFDQPVNLQLIARPVKTSGGIVMFRLEENCSFPENPTKKINNGLFIGFSLRETVFYLQQYERLMAEHGLKPTMGSQDNMQPNLASIMEEYMIEPVKWPEGMALIGPVQSLALKMRKEFPPLGLRLQDVERSQAPFSLPDF